MSFIFAEKHYDESLGRELCSLHCDTRIIPDPGSKTNFSKEQLEAVNKWGIVKCSILSPNLCIAFAGNNIKYAAELISKLFDLKRFELEEAIQIAFEIHSNTESVNDIEFIILAYEEEMFKITSVREQTIIRDCQQCYIGSPDAYKFFRSISSTKDISSAFEETVDGCKDRSVGGFHVSVIYGIEEQSFVYAYTRAFASFKHATVKQEAPIPFFLSAADGGFSYEIYDISLEEILLSIDQMEHKVLFTRNKRYCTEDIANKNLSGLMLPMEICCDNGIWKRR